MQRLLADAVDAGLLTFDCERGRQRTEISRLKVRLGLDDEVGRWLLALGF
jgi:hypothetical protein